ncbi:MAG: hypothetical protein ACXAC8_13105 [Candidatus Hodarchaeales archaeon]|jgi:hypothetical protein
MCPLLLKIRFRNIFSLFFLSLLIASIVQLIIGFSYFNPVDFVLQFESAKQIAQGKLLYRDIGSVIINGTQLPRPQYPPLYLYTLGFLIAIIGVDNFTWQMVKIFLITVNLIVGILIYNIVLNSFQSHPKRQFLALGALNWFLLNPATLGIILGGYHENFMLFFVLLGLILFGNRHYFWSGVFFGMSLLVKPIAGIYLIPLLIWSIHNHSIKSMLIWFTAVFTFLLGSVPFLFLAPEEYISDVFLIHTQRLDPSMSLYTYFFTALSSTLVPFLIQLIILGTCLIFLLRKIHVENFIEALETILPFVTIFLATNRILYPHYIQFCFPFFTITLFILIAEYYNPIRRKNIKFSIYSMIFSLLVVYFGSFIWSLLWLNEWYQTYQTNPLFLISALICVFGLFIMSATSIHSLLNSKMRFPLIAKS